MDKIFKSTDTSIRIAMLRNSERLSQQKFADKLNVERETVAYWETGQRNPSYKHIKLLCTMFKVSADWLMGFSDEMYRKDLHKTS